MSLRLYRGSIALAVVGIALISATAAEAQYFRGAPREPGGLVNDVITGVEYDRVNQALAERRLQKVQGKLRRNAERCNSAAVDRDVRQIENLRYRIVVDEWLIRQNSLLDPGCYPHALRLDPMSCEAIAAASRPEYVPNPQR